MDKKFRISDNGTLEHISEECPDSSKADFDRNFSHEFDTSKQNSILFHDYDNYEYYAVDLVKDFKDKNDYYKPTVAETKEVKLDANDNELNSKCSNLTPTSNDCSISRIVYDSSSFNSILTNADYSSNAANIKFAEKCDISIESMNTGVESLIFYNEDY